MFHLPRTNTTLDLSGRPKIMGILNITPDSFSDGGAYFDPTAAVERALAMIGEGADIIDIGGESTRPGALPVDHEAEIARVLPTLRELRRISGIPISIDTRKASVARAALDEGADIINDISAMTHDPAMREVAARARCPVILMHMQGRPETMQDAPTYDSVVDEVRAYLAERIAWCREAGIASIAVDPGIGFGKRLEDNLALLANLGEFKTLNVPLVIGASRKSFLGFLTGAGPAERGPASVAAGVVAMMHGASMLRVHDVRDHVDACKVAWAIQSQTRNAR